MILDYSSDFWLNSNLLLKKKKQYFFRRHQFFLLSVTQQSISLVKKKKNQRVKAHFFSFFQIECLVQACDCRRRFVFSRFFFS